MGITGNKEADMEAKEAVQATRMDLTRVRRMDMKYALRKYILNKWEAKRKNSLLSIDKNYRSIHQSILPWHLPRNVSCGYDKIIPHLRIGHSHHIAYTVSFQSRMMLHQSVIIVSSC